MTASPFPSAELAIMDYRVNWALKQGDRRTDLLGEQLDALNDRIADLEATVARHERNIAWLLAIAEKNAGVLAMLVNRTAAA